MALAIMTRFSHLADRRRDGSGRQEVQEVLGSPRSLRLKTSLGVSGGLGGSMGVCFVKTTLVVLFTN